MDNRRPAIVLVAFGVSSEEAWKVYGHIETAVRRHRPDHEVHWAFTSHKIAAKLRGQGREVPTLEEAMAGLRRRGVRAAVLQSLLTVPGQEYAKIATLAREGLEVAYGGSLLADEGSVDEVMAALDGEIQPWSVNVVVCHGNRRHAAYNAPLLALARRLEAARPNVVVASVEGSPGAAPLERAREMARAAGAVHFIPFMLVAGEHVTHDVMGLHAGSWRSRVEAPRVTCAPPLGWNPGILKIYLKRLDAALAELEGKTP